MVAPCPGPRASSLVLARWLLWSASTAAPAAAVIRTGRDDLFGATRIVGGSKRIIGGSQAPEDRYPYSISLQDGKHFCGGSLIAADCILTAAHCLAGGWFDVRVGSDDVDDGPLIETRKKFPHPDYNEPTDQNDFALVFLDESADDDVPLVRVNRDNNVPEAGTMAVVMGWGDTDESEDRTKMPDHMREVRLEVITNQECSRAESGDDSYSGWIYDNMLCTYTKDKDACQGDSGGPLIVKGDGPEDDVQIGIVSWGVGCAHLPGVFSRISTVYDWIEETVCEHSRKPPEYMCGPTTPGPTPHPTRRPTPNPTPFPTKRPTPRPTRNPTFSPSQSPTTTAPTASPFAAPSAAPSVSSAPTDRPSAGPTLSSVPTSQPSAAPSTSAVPSAVPSTRPSISARPSSQPTSQPSSGPTGMPSSMPSVVPSSQPSGGPTSRPSSQPSASSAPSTSTPPSLLPSRTPSSGPSESPTTTISPTASNGPTTSALPTRKRIPSDALRAQSSIAIGAEETNGSSRTGLNAVISALLCGIVCVWVAV